MPCVGRDARQRGDTGDVGGPRRNTPFRGLGRVDSGVGRGIDDRVVIAPGARRTKITGGEIEVGAFGELDVRRVSVRLAQSVAQLPAGAEDQGLARRNRDDLGQARLGAVLRRQFGLSRAESAS